MDYHLYRVDSPYCPILLLSLAKLVSGMITLAAGGYNRHMKSPHVGDLAYIQHRLVGAQ